MKKMRYTKNLTKGRVTEDLKVSLTAWQEV